MQLPNIYLTEFTHVACQAFSMWNRDPASPSFGSFDRQYWGWKKKDFSDATLQYAVKLAVEYSHIAGMTSTIPKLLEGYVDYCKRIQLKDGSFDQCYPNERTPGVIYDLLSTFIYVRQSPYLQSQNAQNSLDGVMERAISFALKTDEKHGNIANHLAQYAYELFYYAAYTGDEKAHAGGEAYFERLLALLDDTEGWFQEYQGPDAGYQTRSLRYITKCAVLLDKPEIWNIVRKAADFIDNLLMPDCSIHPMLGTRSTALLYPFAFETLALHDSAYQKLAYRVRKGWSNAQVPLPSWLDFDNAIKLAEDAKDAADAYASNTTDTCTSFDDCKTGNATEQVDLPNAGIKIIRNKRLVVYIGYRLGGVVVAYKKCENKEWKLLYEDSGYLLHSIGLGIVWVTRMPDSGSLMENSDGRLLIKTHFYQSLHDEVTPFRIILLRLLNMTVLRSQWLGDLFRKLVVRRIICGNMKVPITLLREITFTPDKIRISDRISDERKANRSFKKDKLFRCRRITGSHMASARYFQSQELEEMALDWMQEFPMSKDRNVMNTIEVNIEETNN